MSSPQPWAKAGSEPSPLDLLADPICQALMRADDVDIGDVMELIRLMRPSTGRPIRGNDRYPALPAERYASRGMAMSAMRRAGYGLGDAGTRR